MKYMEERLPVDRFIRVHRSYIVRMDSVSIVEDNSVIVGEKSLPIGASYRKRVKDCKIRKMQRGQSPVRTLRKIYKSFTVFLRGTD